jgi:hypothetical protein
VDPGNATQAKMAAMAAEESHPPITRVRDDRTWRIGSDADVAWIKHGTSTRTAVTAAIPPIFAAYATLDLPESWDEEEQQRHDQVLLALLSEHSSPQSWWLGYLDTGADDIVFPDAPTVILYTGWRYMLVEAGPQQAGTWRHSDAGTFWKGALPNLMFPADHAWLVSTLWDDAWTYVGGSAALVAGLRRHPVLQTHVKLVDVGRDVKFTP